MSYVTGGWALRWLFVGVAVGAQLVLQLRLSACWHALHHDGDELLSL